MARMARCEGPVISIGTVCSASAHAIGEAFQCIQDGEADLAIAGGFDASTTFLDILGFSLLGALAADSNDRPGRGSRPFAADRAGMVVGEGAVVLVLEELEAATARGAPIRAELLGYGSGLNTWRLAGPDPDDRGGAAAMSEALAQSGLGPDRIDYVVGHGAGTPASDLAEVVAIKAVFGSHAPKLAISSPKSMTGNLMCAAAALNALVAVCAIQHGVIPPTVNLQACDPQLGLDFVPNHSSQRPVRAALINGFGETNASLVFGAGPS
jgi:3-oxoacyl-[acyl-carrier-protein] synthase II